jgi:gluconokinase
MLFDPKTASVVRSAGEPYPFDICHAGGETGLHDADKVVRQLIRIGRAVAGDAGVEAVVPCGTFHSALVCDKNMTPQTPVYTWEYGGAKRFAADLRKSNDYTKAFYHRTGCMVHALYPAIQLMYINRRQGLRFDNRYIASQSGYVFYQLTGERRETACTNSGGGLINVHTRGWDAETLADIGICAGQLGRIAGFRETVPLSATGAALLGIKSGIPVLPSQPDGALNQVGSGALGEGVMTFSVGTSGALRLSVPKPVIPDTPSTWCYLSPDSWMSGAAASGACNCVDWIKSVLFPNQSYPEIEREPVDYRGMPYFLPFLFGERCPGWNDGRRGGFQGLLAKHMPRDMYFSVLEGVLFNLYQCYQVLCGIAGTPHTIQLSGGILNSAVWKQMCADIFGQEMTCAKVSQASLMGGAVLAMAVMGHIARIEDYQVETQGIILPNPAGHEIFEKRFVEYMALYNNIKEAYEYF